MNRERKRWTARPCGAFFCVVHGRIKKIPPRRRQREGGSREERE